jgi:hypothetical protein
VKRGESHTRPHDESIGVSHAARCVPPLKRAALRRGASGLLNDRAKRGNGALRALVSTPQIITLRHWYVALSSPRLGPRDELEVLSRTQIGNHVIE